MRHKLPAVLMAALALVTAAAPLPAHHSFAAEFDQNKALTLQGVVTKVEWMNPHIFVYIDVKDDKGNVSNWSLEGFPPNTLYRQGWRKDTIKPGDTITVSAYSAKDGSTTASIRTVSTMDGRKLFTGPGSAVPEGPRK